MRGLLAAAVAGACALLMISPQVAAADGLPLPLPGGNTCVPGIPRYKANYEFFEGADDRPHKILPGQTVSLSNSVTGTVEATVSAGAGLEIDAVVAKAKADINVGAKRSVTVTRTASVSFENRVGTLTP